MEHPIFRLLKDKFLSPKVAITFVDDTIWVSADKKKYSFYDALRLRSDASPHHKLNPTYTAPGEVRYMLRYDESKSKGERISSYLVIARIDINIDESKTVIRVVTDDFCHSLDLCDPNSINSLVELIAKQIDKDE